jgi:hypothetical protein
MVAIKGASRWLDALTGADRPAETAAVMSATLSLRAPG